VGRERGVHRQPPARQPRLLPCRPRRPAGDEKTRGHLRRGFFDHEEVGSESAAGAGGSFITDVLTRIALQTGVDAEDRHRALAQSFFISADMAHAYHPNFPAAYEPGHKVHVNGGR